MTKKQYSLMLVLALVVALFLLPTTSSFGEEKKIWLAGMEMHLGMTKGEILQKIEKHYTIRNKETNSWLIISKEGPPYEMVGNVYFKNGKLFTVIKYWGSFKGDTAHNLGNALFSLLSNINEEGKEYAAIKTHSQRQPDHTSHHIRIYFPGKEISIGIHEGRLIGKEISINEKISQ